MLIDNSAKTNWTAIIILLLITAAIVAGIYWCQGQQKTEEPATVTSKPEAMLTEEVIPAAKEAPTQVVENFMNYTLGTLPNSEINYDAARYLFTKELKAQYSDDYFVPRFYGIQDGPDSVKIISESISGNEAIVRVDATFGEMTIAWAFNLVREDNTWLINGFRNDAQ